MSKEKEEKKTLYHYTNEAGLKEANNPREAVYGDGQYVTDIVPSDQSPEKLSTIFVGNPDLSYKYNYYIEIDVSGLDVIKGREHVFLIPNN